MDTGPHHKRFANSAVFLVITTLATLLLLSLHTAWSAETQAPKLKFVTDPESVTVPEGGTATFGVKLNQKPSSPVTATVFRSGGDTDITVISESTLTFDNDNYKNFQEVTLFAAEDTDGDNGTATIRIRDVESVIPDADVTATESDDDGGTPSVSFTSDGQSGPESVGTMVATVQLSSPSDLAVTVPYTVSGTAGSPSDYTISPTGSVSIPAGSTTADITISVADDGVPEADETVIITLGIPTNADRGSPSVHTATITDNDGVPRVFFTSADTGNPETVPTGVLRVALSHGSSLTVTVGYAVTGGTATGGGVDYTLSDGTLTFTPGQTERTISIVIHDDGIDEADETVVVGLQNPVNATLGIPSTHTYTIIDDDAPITFVTDTGSVAVPEGGTATFQVRLSGQPPSDVTANVIRADGDADIIVISGNSLTFTPINWSEFQNVTLTAAEDPDGVNGTATIRVSHTGSVIPDADVTATEADNENNAIIVTAPDGGETWGLGETHEITWLSTGTTGETVTIELIRGRSLERTIIPSTPNDGSFSWAVPGDLTPGDDFRVRVTSLSDDAITDESDEVFSITDLGQDTDTDGVPDREEMGPEGTDESYDGNSDGIPDSQQNTVASFHTHDDTHYVTLEATGELGSVSTMPPPPDTPGDITFPYGFFEFVITAAEQGGPASAILYTDGTIANTYYKFGATPDNFVPHWYEFQFDAETVTGAEFNGFLITLHFVDGLRGDDDLSANRAVIDQGGPGVTVSAEDKEAAGSDCFIATAVFGSGEDPSVIILRRFRDTHLLATRPGRLFVDTYYRLSPPAAKWLANHEEARFITRALLTPVTITCWFVLWTGSFLSLLFPLALLVLLVISGTGKRVSLPRR